MDAHAYRVLAYMAQSADEGIEYKTQRGKGTQLIAYSDSDLAVAHSTTGFCVMYGGAAVGIILPSCLARRSKAVALSMSPAGVWNNSNAPRFCLRCPCCPSASMPLPSITPPPFTVFVETTVSRVGSVR
eukprot:2081874-Pleurochrysis_carterae.AAC.1